MVESEAETATHGQWAEASVTERWVADLIRRYPRLGECQSDITKACEVLLHAAANGGTVFTCGNGGSYSDSQHIVGELMKCFHKPRPVSEGRAQALRDAAGETGEYLASHLEASLPALALGSQGALLTAFANDVDPNLIFAQELEGYGREGDVLLCLSSSGNSKNVLYAVQVARSKEIPTILLTGSKGGAISHLVTVTVSVPETDTYKIQDLHLPIYHTLCLVLEDAHL